MWINDPAVSEVTIKDGYYYDLDGFKTEKRIFNTRKGAIINKIIKHKNKLMKHRMAIKLLEEELYHVALEEKAG